MERHTFARPQKTSISAANQGGALENQTKSRMDMWRELSQKIYLPDAKSKGCTKDYLKKVAEDKVYSVSRVKIGKYLVEEVPEKRVLRYQWRTEVEYPRLEAYLSSLNKKPLGFDIDTGYPNEKWLMEIVRYEDPMNILGIYAFIGPPRSDINYSQNKLFKQKLMMDDVNDWLFSKDMRKKAKWKSAKNEATNKSKICITQKALIEKLENQLDKAKRDLRTFESERSASQSQLLSMVDGRKALKLDYQAIANPADNSNEKKQMLEFMYGWLFLLVFK